MTALLVVLVLFGAFATTGCGSSGSGSSISVSPDWTKIASMPNTPLVLILGARANSPLFTPPQELVDYIANAVSKNDYISVIVADGEPGVAKVATDNGDVPLQGTFGSTAVREDTKQHDDTATVSTLVNLLESKVVAKKPEADLWSAFALSARELNSIPADAGEKHLTIWDSGLATKGEINFTRDGMFSVDPQAYADQIPAAEIPTFDGKITCDWYCVGDTAGNTQKSLSTGQRSEVKAIYTAALKRANLTVNYREDVPGTEMVKGAPAVATVNVPTPLAPVVAASKQWDLDPGTLTFLPDKAVYRDPEQADTVLKPFAQMMLDNPTMRLKITGMTATGTNPEFCLQLSKDRADKVRDTILSIDPGIDPARFETVGVGDNVHPVIDPPLKHYDDLDSTGQQIPSIAEKNRIVRIEVEN